MKVAQSCPTLCDPMDYIACLAPLSMEFSRQEYWSGLPFPSPGDLPDPGIKPGFPVLQAEDMLPGEDILLSILPFFFFLKKYLKYLNVSFRQQIQPQFISGWVMVPDSWWQGVGGGRLDLGSHSLYESFGPSALCCFPASFQGLESYSCFNCSGNPGQMDLGFNVHMLLSVSLRLSIPFFFFFSCEGQAFPGKKEHPVSLTCSAVNLWRPLINLGRVWPRTGTQSHSASCQLANVLSRSPSS